MNDGGESRNTITNYGGGDGSAPCGACKFLRRKCMATCVFAPHFSSDQGVAQFSSVHKIFGASNTTKLLNLIPENQRREAIHSILYEAQARLRDPIYGCVRMIIALQREVTKLQTEISQLKSQKEVINRPALSTTMPTTRTMSQHPDLTLHLYTPQLPNEGEDMHSSRYQPLCARARNQLPSDNNRQDKGKQIEGIGSSGKRVGHEDSTLWDNDDNIAVPPLVRPRVGGPSCSSYGHETENAKSTLQEILSLSFSAVVQRENDVISAVRTLLNSSSLSLDQCVMLTKLKSELSHLVNEYQLAEAKFNYHDNKIKKRDKDVASIAMMKEAHDKSRMKEVELFEENEKIKKEIQQLKNKMMKNQELIENLMVVRNEETLVINRLKASLEATATEVEGWLEAKDTAEKAMIDASKKWDTFEFDV